VTGPQGSADPFPADLDRRTEAKVRVNGSSFRPCGRRTPAAPARRPLAASSDGRATALHGRARSQNVGAPRDEHGKDFVCAAAFYAG